MNPKKRGIQPGYIRTLELALAWVFSNVSGSEQALDAVLSDNGSAGQSILVGKDTDGSYKLHRKWRKSTVCKEIERLLSGNDVTDPGAHPHSNERLSPDDEEDVTNTGQDAAMLTPSSAGAPIKYPSDPQDRERSNAMGSAQTGRSQYPLEAAQTSAGAESRQGEGLFSTPSSAAVIGIPHGLFMNRTGTAHGTHGFFEELRYSGPSHISRSVGDQSTASYATGSASVSDPSRMRNNSLGHTDTIKYLPSDGPGVAVRRASLKLPVNLWRLFDLYFAYTHCWFPIAEKHDVLKDSYSYPEEGLEMTAEAIDSGSHAELWSILALASFQEGSLSSEEGMSDMKVRSTSFRLLLFSPCRCRRSRHTVTRRFWNCRIGSSS